MWKTFVTYALHTIKPTKFKSDTGANKTELKLNSSDNKNKTETMKFNGN